MRRVRFLCAGLVGVVVALSPAAFLSGCGDDVQTGKQMKESEESKQARAKEEDKMRELMTKKAAPAGKAATKTPAAK